MVVMVSPHHKWWRINHEWPTTMQQKHSTPKSRPYCFTYGKHWQTIEIVLVTHSYCWFLRRLVVLELGLGAAGDGLAWSWVGCDNVPCHAWVSVDDHGCSHQSPHCDQHVHYQSLSSVVSPCGWSLWARIQAVQHSSRIPSSIPSSFWSIIT